MPNPDGSLVPEYVCDGLHLTPCSTSERSKRSTGCCRWPRHQRAAGIVVRDGSSSFDDGKVVCRRRREWRSCRFTAGDKVVAGATGPSDGEKVDADRHESNRTLAKDSERNTSRNVGVFHPQSVSDRCLMPGLHDPGHGRVCPTCRWTCFRRLIPVVAVATFYSGMPPQQIEANITYHLERQFTLASGIDHMESRSLPGVWLIKVFFRAGRTLMLMPRPSLPWR